MFRASVNSGILRVLCKLREANEKKCKDLILIILAKPFDLIHKQKGKQFR